jgi:hypothetical protein
MLSASAPARGGGGAATDAYQGISEAPLEVHGFIDVYDQGNFGDPLAGAALLRAYDTSADRPSLGLARLTVAHAPSSIGFRLDVGAGDFADAYLHFDPASTDYRRLSRDLSYVEQAFVSVKIPIERQPEIDVGKFGTPVGLEDNESLGNWNYSRSLLFLLAEPSYHSGVRVTYPVSGTLAASVFWVNGWDTNVADGNAMRTFAAAATWTPQPGVALYLTYMAGPERAITRLADPALAFRNVVDASASYELTRRLTLAATGDYGHDDAQGGVRWWGVGGYVREVFQEWLVGSLRGEHYDDEDGFSSGTPQRLAELTATLELRTRWGPLAASERLEYRRDQSDAPVFLGGSSGPSTHQDTVCLGLLVAF